MGAAEPKGIVVHEMGNDTMEMRIETEKRGDRTQVPHEWLFADILGRREILNHPELADEFIMFIAQYHPNCKLHAGFGNNFDTAVINLNLVNAEYSKKYTYRRPECQDLDPAFMELGDIATEFLIRRRNYSLVKAMGKNIIQTAQSDCHKRFEEQLSGINGAHTLQKFAKINFIPIEESLKKATGSQELANDPEFKKFLGIHPLYKGCFEKLPVLPTRDMGYKIDEMIERPDGKFERVL